MFMIHEWNPASPRRVPTVVASVGERAATIRVRQRRRWVLRSLFMTTLTAVLLCVLVAWKRDHMTTEAGMRRLEEPVAQLQARIDRLNQIPVTLPPLAYRASDQLRHFAMSTDDPVMLAASEPIQLLLAEDGCCVIVYERGKVRSEWMTLSQFRDAWKAEDQKLHAYNEKRRAEVPALP